MKELEKILGYTFKNKELLKQALTRQSAIEEKIPGAATANYQTLEFVGDAALKHAIAKILFKRAEKNCSPEDLHSHAVKLITNEGVLPAIAKKIGLPKLLIKGKGEATVTDKMCADALEAVLGAISMDNSKKGLMSVIEKLWGPYLPEKIVAQTKTVAAINSSSSNTTSSQPQPANYSPSTNGIATVNTAFPLQALPAPEQRIFTGISRKTTLEQFQKALNVNPKPDVNKKNIGKVGNTPLMALLTRATLNELDIAKAELLIKHGALWTAKNNKGETANDLAKNHTPTVIEKLRTIKP